MGNPDHAESCFIEIKSSDVCLKMLERNKAQINYLLKASQPPCCWVLGWRSLCLQERLMDWVPRGWGAQ